MSIDFSNKNILITGGSRGLGANFAKKFLSLNASIVFITGTKKQPPEWIKKSIYKKRIKYFQLDQYSNNFLINFKNFLKDKKKIDILINNAGININNNIDSLDYKILNKILTVNLESAIQIASLVSKIMIKKNSGKIINIGSIWSEISKSKRSVYSASKSGLIGATRGIAIDLAKNNILVNSISPGFVKTELTKKNLSKTEIKKIKKQIPLKRFANVEEITNFVVFLSSNKNTYITGQNIIVDGGFSIG
tara:strand:+ start:4209 stop:4955 length:747 start_codon:yes stop_codon:yes gene_type:complete